ncbi:hypothetical protein [Streptosporangium sp. NPDC002524]|uniref:hypothetical protein n=1 Tax=Streptosporangium sp. NPDC002524 TaxID=3154537 RepID=UPI003322F451
MYDIATLETARRYTWELCHPADVQRGRETAFSLWPEDATSTDTPPHPSTTTVRTRTAPQASEHREQAAPQPPETTARTRNAALTGTPREPAAPRTPETTSRPPGKARALQARGNAQAPPPAAVTAEKVTIAEKTVATEKQAPAATEKEAPAASGKQAPVALEKPAEAHPPQTQQAQQAQQAQHPTRLQQTDAKRLLKAAGLRWTSSGKCANRQGRNCTSLDAVRSTTVSSAIDLKRRSGCPLVVTGGTEVGHAPGPYSHYEGYKLDIKPNACVNRYITKNYPPQGVRGDGARLYGQSPTSGPLFAREADHWDILFR